MGGEGRRAGGRTAVWCDWVVGEAGGGWGPAAPAVEEQARCSFRRLSSPPSHIDCCSYIMPPCLPYPSRPSSFLLPQLPKNAKRAPVVTIAGGMPKKSKQQR